MLETIASARQALRGIDVVQRRGAVDALARLGAPTRCHEIIM